MVVLSVVENMRLARELQADFPQPRPLIEVADQLNCQKKKKERQPKYV